jgi:deoxyribodipyrimidine photo-lyase
MNDGIVVFWFRRDLRLHDNAGLYYALKQNKAVMPVFIFDTDILNELEEKEDRRVHFIHQVVTHLKAQLHKKGSDLKVYYGTPLKSFKKLVSEYKIMAVYCNHDYEPYAIKRDKEINDFLETKGIAFNTYKDQCIFEKDEVTKDDGKPYTVFTPYSRKWKNKLKPFYYRSYPTEKYFSDFYKCKSESLLSLEEIGFNNTNIVFKPVTGISRSVLKHYKEQRDIPALHGTSRMGIHLRFGTVSIRQLVQAAVKESDTYLNELIWRDFYMMILYHFLHAANSAFKKEYNNIAWRNNEKEFDLWCRGMTGFAIVDAGMRELNGTGFMHNRVRMIVSSFLVKDLLIDWRWGEAYFAKKLDDFDLSANNGGWQWAAGSGCDAAPYFRVFNPLTQQQKFDPDLNYIKKWVPEFNTPAYPLPMVDHAAARLRALKVYKEALSDHHQTKLF